MCGSPIIAPAVSCLSQARIIRKQGLKIYMVNPLLSSERPYKLKTRIFRILLPWDEHYQPTSDSSPTVATRQHRELKRCGLKPDVTHIFRE